MFELQFLSRSAYLWDNVKCTGEMCSTTCRQKKAFVADTSQSRQLFEFQLLVQMENKSLSCQLLTTIHFIEQIYTSSCVGSFCFEISRRDHCCSEERFLYIQGAYHLSEETGGMNNGKGFSKISKPTERDGAYHLQSNFL